MTCHAPTEPLDLHLPVAMGSFGTGGAVPDADVPDLKLENLPDLVLGAGDRADWRGRGLTSQ